MKFSGVSLLFKAVKLKSDCRSVTSVMKYSTSDLGFIMFVSSCTDGVMLVHFPNLLTFVKCEQATESSVAWWEQQVLLPSSAAWCVLRCCLFIILSLHTVYFKVSLIASSCIIDIRKTK